MPSGNALPGSPPGQGLPAAAPTRRLVLPKDCPMPTAVTRILLSLLLLLPLAAHAGDAQDFVAANPAKQASLLERWSAAPEAARLPLLEALQQGRVAADSAKTAFIETAGNYQAAEGEAQPARPHRHCGGQPPAAG